MGFSMSDMVQDSQMLVLFCQAHHCSASAKLGRQFFDFLLPWGDVDLSFQLTG